MKKRVLLIATHDTKEEEAFFLRQRIEARGVEVLVMDTGILGPPTRQIDISQDEVAGEFQQGAKAQPGHGGQRYRKP